MRNVARVVLALSMAALAGAAVPAAAAAKCRPTADRPLHPLHALMVDGTVTAEYAAGTAPTLPPTEDIVAVEIRCREVVTERGTVMQNMISVVTRAGAPALMERYLAELVEAQRAHHARTGSWAPTLIALRFLDARAPVPIEMDVTDTGWSASTTMSGVQTTCSVAVGAGADTGPDGRQVGGVPACRPAA